MVELLSDDFGIEVDEGDGKRVWFRLGVTPGTPEPEPPSPAAPPTETFSLRLERLPVDLYCVFQQHADALLREAVIVCLDESSSTPGAEFPLAGQALGALADAATDVFALRDADVDVADVTLSLARPAVPLFPILREMLARAAAMSEAGQLLVPPSLPEIEGLRNWICDQIARQTAGLAPQPWTGVAADDAVRKPALASTLDAVRASPSCVVAADASNRIVAVSTAAAALLGWEQTELEGRRLVSIIPPRLRDRHVAGFTRNLLDGTSRILGRGVEVPALRRDGSEVAVTLLIERRADPQTRALFVATLTPA
jgi:PAS domain S-box-containing protein